MIHSYDFLSLSVSFNGGAYDLDTLGSNTVSQIKIQAPLTMLLAVVTYAPLWTKSG